MKKTVARKAFAAASALIMCGNTMAFAGESTGSTTTPQFEDRVALDVVAFVGSGELDGLYQMFSYYRTQQNSFRCFLSLHLY